jgi:hypothetical protein
VPSPTPLDQWLTEYDTYLAHVVGVALSTRQYYRRIVRRFVSTCFGTAPPDWQAVTAPMITAFVRHEANRCQGGWPQAARGSRPLFSAVSGIPRGDTPWFRSRCPLTPAVAPCCTPVTPDA